MAYRTERRLSRKARVLREEFIREKQKKERPKAIHVQASPPMKLSEDKRLAPKAGMREQGPAELFTVAFVTYNQRHRLEEAIDSVIQQSHGRIQLIVLDDCSCDFDEDEVRAYIGREKHNNIVQADVVRLEEHQGPACAYQKALDLVVGEYVLFLGGDDRLASGTAIAQVLRGFERTSASFLQCTAVQIRNFRRIHEPEAEVLKALKEKDPLDVMIDAATQTSEHYICLQAMAMRTKNLRRMGGFDPCFPNAFDWTLLFGILQEESAQLVAWDEVITLKLDKGAYHNDGVGTGYLREAYLQETGGVIASMALPTFQRMGDRTLIDRCNRAINARENWCVLQFHWYHFSFREKLAWRMAHRGEFKLKKRIDKAARM